MNGLKFDFSKIFWGGAHRAPSPDPSPRSSSGFALGSGFALNSRALRALDSGFAQSCPRVWLTRGSGRVTISPDSGGSGGVSTSDFQVFTDYFLVPESLWMFKYYYTFGLIDFLRYLIYNN